MADRAPRDERGRFVPRQCPDADCDGELVPDRPGMWICNGLLGRGEDELQACPRCHWDGDRYDR